MKITFLGTNGWYDTETGNTPSILIESKDYYVVLDAGFGFYKLNKLIKKDKPIFLFITHFHLDHICGLHILPLFEFKQTLTILGGKNLKKMLKLFAEHPFTGSLSGLRYKVKSIELKEGGYKQPFPFECKKLNHADYTLGYRLYLDDKVITYCSDTGPCENSYLLAKDSDIFIHECALLPGEKDGWGHTSPDDAAKIAKRAEAKQLLLTHFDASKYKSKSARKKAENVAKKIFPSTQAAFDDFVIKL